MFSFFQRKKTPRVTPLALISMGASPVPRRAPSSLPATRTRYVQPSGYPSSVNTVTEYDSGSNVVAAVMMAEALSSMDPGVAQADTFSGGGGDFGGGGSSADYSSPAPDTSSYDSSSITSSYDSGSSYDSSSSSYDSGSSSYDSGSSSSDSGSW